MSHLGFSIHNDAGREVAFLSYFQCTPDEADHVADLLCYGLPESKMELRIYQRSVAAETARMFGNRAPAPEPMVVDEDDDEEMDIEVLDEGEENEFMVKGGAARRLAGQIVTDRGERNV